MLNCRGKRSWSGNILALQTQIAEIQGLAKTPWPRSYLNQIERSKLSDEYPGFDWDTYFAQTGYKVPELNITQPEPVKTLKLLTKLISWLKSYLKYHTSQTLSSFEDST